MTGPDDTIPPTSVRVMTAAGEAREGATAARQMVESAEILHDHVGGLLASLREHAAAAEMLARRLETDAMEGV